MKSETNTENAMGNYYQERLVSLADKCDEFCLILSLHRDKFPQVWGAFVKLWNSNEDVWKRIGGKKLGHIEDIADASFYRYTKNFGHHSGFLEHACLHLAAILRSEVNLTIIKK